jgi:hypothetical protein
VYNSRTHSRETSKSATRLTWVYTDIEMVNDLADFVFHRTTLLGLKLPEIKMNYILTFSVSFSEYIMGIE